MLTDLHTHILPGLDDGAADLAEAIAMAQAAAADGIVRLAATPHNLRLPSDAGRAELEAQAARLQEHLAARGIPLQVVAGAETALIPALPQQIDAGQVITLNRSRYLLVELPYMGLPARLEEIIFQVQARGLVPILAHPERNADLLRRPERLRALVERGMLVQVTAASLEAAPPGREPGARHRLRRPQPHRSPPPPRQGPGAGGGDRRPRAGYRARGDHARRHPG